MIVIPQLSHAFWESHPALTHIRASAWESKGNPASPDAVLGVLMCRVAAMVDPTTILPDGGTLNYLVAIIGPSGVGKTTSKRLATKLIPSINTPLDSVGVGSGEGLIEAYLRKDKDENGKDCKVQHHTSAFFYVDEAETFLRSSKREGSTTLGTLRSMWTGTDVGSSNATLDTSRRLKDGTYRFTCAMGFQPDYAIQLIRDDKAGTPQRFLYVSAMDRHLPNVSYPTPYALVTTVPPANTQLHVDSEILRLIRDKRRRIMRGELEIDPLETHGDLLQLKTAAILSLLCGTTSGVTLEWWNRARELVEVSNSIRNHLLDLGRQSERDSRIEKVEQRIESDEIRAERDLMRISANLGRNARREGPCHPEKLINALAYRDRHKADIDHAIRHGFLKAGNAANQYVAGPNAPALTEK